MSEERQLPDVSEDKPGEERQLALPAWVPAAIGLTLVTLAALAVYTGFTIRVKPTERAAEVGSPFSEADGLYPEDSGGPPGSPEPGASRVRPGSEVPVPGSLEGVERSPASGAGDVSGHVSVTVRRGIVFKVQPSDAVVYVNDVEVGAASQFATGDDAYEFAEEGVFIVRIAAAGHHEVEVVVSAEQAASNEIAEILRQLEPVR